MPLGYSRDPDVCNRLSVSVPKNEPQSYRSFFEWYMRNTYTHYGSVGADAGEAAA
jgi:hypothetical protein